MFAGPQQTLFPNERSTYPEACMKSRLVLIAFLLATPQLAVADDICAKNPASTQQSPSSSGASKSGDIWTPA